MAIYSLNLGFISRSEGRSSVGFSAYMGRSVQQDERTGVRYSYDNRQDVLVSRVLAPEGAPEWAKQAPSLWNTVEKFEDQCAELRFRGDAHDPEKHQRSLAAKEKFLSSTQTAQTIMGAIPLEFTPLEAEMCVEGFLKERFVSRGLVVEYAIHGDEGNPHFHGLITRRPLVEDVFSLRKDRDIVTKHELLITRKLWEDAVNKHLALGGHEVRIDSRSYADQGLALLPTRHEGWYAQRLAERGEYSRIVADNEAIRQKNIEILCHNPAALIHELTLKRTIFTKKHVEEEILRRVGGDDKLFTLLKAKVDGLELPSELVLKQANDNREVLFEGGHASNFARYLARYVEQFTTQILSNEEIVARVGENLNRNPVFTSTAYKTQEEQIIKLGDDLHARQSQDVPEAFVENSISTREEELGFALSEEQKLAITHLCSGPDICILNGKAGTGKTTLLKAVAEAYQEAGYQVRGTSFQGKAVEIMEREIGISCKTLDSFKYAWEKHQNALDSLESGRLWGKAYRYAVKIAGDLEPQRLTSRDVIIVDEANMVGNHLWEPLLREATGKGAKVLIVQDPAQIKSREPGDTGRLFAERFGYVETHEVVRQRIPWQRECSKLLNDHQVLDGLKPYHEKGHIHWQETDIQAIKQLSHDYLQDTSSSRIALAYRNADVYALNQAIREGLKSQGYLQEGVKVGGEEYAIGERIRFTQNDHYGTYVKDVPDSLRQYFNGSATPSQGIGVKNGTFGTIEAIEGQELRVVLDDHRHVQFIASEYPHITHGYALGIHKSEGSTFDKSFVLLDPLMDPSTLLVGLTRHREDVQIYFSREDFQDFKDVVDRLRRPALSQTTQDYHIKEDQRPAFERVQSYRDLTLEVANLREEIESTLDPETPLYKHASYGAYQALLQEKKQLAGTLLQSWEQHAPYLRLAGIRKDVLECEVGIRERLLSDLEHRASLQVQGYMDLVRETRSLWKTISATHPGILAKSHELYKDYQAQKKERDSLASVIQEQPRLYGPFFKAVTDPETGEIKDYWGETLQKGERVYFATTKSHAAAHMKAQLQSLFYERLSPEQKAYYEEVKAYMNARNEASAIYSQLKKQESGVSSQITFEAFRTHQINRDTLALKIVESPDKYQEFFTLLHIKEDKLLDHAVAGELREKAYSYRDESNMAKRATKAQELQRILKTPQDHRIVNEVFKETPGLDLNRLKFDGAFYEGVKSGDISTSISPEEVYKPIQAYLSAVKQVAQLGKIIQLKGQESSDIQQDYEAAFKASLECSKELLANPIAFKVLGDMGPDLQQGVYRYVEGEVSKPDYAYREKPPTISAKQVFEASPGRIAEIAQDLLGDANMRLSTKTTLRFGSKGSLAITLSGTKAGLWKDFESGEGGNIFQLIQREKGLSFKESVSYLANILNVAPLKERSIVHATSSHQKNPSKEDNVLTAKETAARLNAVSELQMKSQPVEGTPAEIYLREERGIKGELAPDLRYLPQGTTFIYQDEWKTLNHPCLAAFGRSQNGRLSSVQLIKLTEEGKRALSREGEKLNKIQYGVAKGSFVCVQEDRIQGRVFIAEGLETALSLKEAGIKGKIVASLGIHNISNYQGSEKEIILCGDNDEQKQHSQTYVILEKAQDIFKTQNKLVSLIKPSHPGEDFNDVLKKQGVQGVQEYLKPYLDPEKQRDRLEQRHDSPGLNTKLPGKDLSLGKEMGGSSSSISSSLPGKQSSLEIIAEYIETKLRDIKAYKGTSLGEQARKELNNYLEPLQKNESLFAELKEHHKDLSRGLERMFKEQEKEHHLHIQRGRDFSL